MDFFIEVISEIFLEGFVEFAKAKKAPKLFRGFVYTVLIFIAGMFLYFSYSLRDDLSLMIFTGLMGLIVLAYTMKIWMEVKQSS